MQLVQGPLAKIRSARQRRETKTAATRKTGSRRESTPIGDLLATYSTSDRVLRISRFPRWNWRQRRLTALYFVSRSRPQLLYSTRRRLTRKTGSRRGARHELGRSRNRRRRRDGGERLATETAIGSGRTSERAAALSGLEMESSAVRCLAGGRLVSQSAEKATFLRK